MAPDRKQRLIEEIIRVNQAGEYGAKRIYEGQLSSTQEPIARKAIEHMAEQELEHLEAFNKLATDRHVKPTVFSPLWHLGAFAMGKATALLGEKAAMACTVAVENVIEEHYREQLNTLKSLEGEEELKEVIQKCYEDEIEHRDTALDHGAEQAPGYKTLSLAVSSASKLAIWISKKV